MRPRLSARARRLVQALAAMFEPPKPAPEPLPHLLRRIPVTSSDCPLPDCSTCASSAPPLDVVVDRQRASDLAYTTGWLVERWPDCWYYEDADKLTTFAAGILDLKMAVLAGRLTP